MPVRLKRPLVTLAALPLLTSALSAQVPVITAGYAAKMLCSTVFVSGRTAEDALKEDLAIAAPVPYRVDRETRSVVAWIPGAAARRAAYHDKLGCILQPDSASIPAARPVPTLAPRSGSIAARRAGSAHSLICRRTPSSSSATTSRMSRSSRRAAWWRSGLGTRRRGAGTSTIS